MAFFDFIKNIFGGGAKGAATGAAAGPYGALLGLGAGALSGGLSSALSKSPRMRNVSQLTPEQQRWQSQLGNLSMQQLQNPYEGFEPIAQQARTQFQQQTIPSLAERFTSMGGGQRSSAFQSALGQAGSGLEGNLAALRSQYGLQNRQLSGSLLSQALRPSFDVIQQPSRPGFLESSLGSLAGPLGQYGTRSFLGSLDDQSQSGMSPEIMQLLQNPKVLQYLKSLGAA